MKILMILDHEFPPDTRVQNEIESLIEENHEIHIACFTQQNKKTLDNFDKAIIHRKPISDFLYKSSVGALKFPFYFNFWRTFVKDLFDQYQFDAIHIHDLPLAKIGMEMSNKHKIKFVLDLHENWPALLSVSIHTKTILGRLLSSQHQWRKYEIASCENADNIIVVVDEAKERLANLGINENKISVVSNTLNLKHFQPPSDLPDPDFITALYAGGINKHRGLQHVIRGIKFLKDMSKPFRLWVIGPGDYVNVLRKITEDEKVIDQITFLGWKSFNEMQYYFSKADICLIPHEKSEHTDSTIPHKLFQYLYSGKPIVASNCAPIERIINETGAGLVYDFNNPKEFAQKVKSIVEDPELSKKIITNGERVVKEKYNWEIDRQLLNGIYKT